MEKQTKKQTSKHGNSGNKTSKNNNKKKKKNNPPKKSKIGLSDNLDLSIKSKSNSKSLLHINKLDTNIDKKLNKLNRNKK